MNKTTEAEQKIQDISALFSGCIDADISNNYPSTLAPTPDLGTDDSWGKFELVYDWTKKLLLFLPGAFFLYLTTLSFVYFPRKLDMYGPFLFWFAAGSFIVWLGLGQIKNITHITIPASIITVSLVLAGVFSLFSLNFNLMYGFPLVLMVPVIVKSLVDRKPAL